MSTAPKARNLRVARSAIEVQLLFYIPTKTFFSTFIEKKYVLKLLV